MSYLDKHQRICEVIPLHLSNGVSNYTLVVTSHHLHIIIIINHKKDKVNNDFFSTSHKISHRAAFHHFHRAKLPCLTEEPRLHLYTSLKQFVFIVNYKKLEVKHFSFAKPALVYGRPLFGGTHNQ